MATMDRIRRVGRIAGSAVFAIACTVACTQVSLSFSDSILVNDTIFHLSDIAEIKGGNDSIVSAVGNCVAGSSAPAGYGRFFSAHSFVANRFGGAFPDVEFTVSGAVRTLVRTDCRKFAIADQEQALLSYIDSATGWNKGEYTVTFSNLNDTLTCLNQPVVISAEGMQERFPRGKTMLYLAVRQGRRVNRVPVLCVFNVRTPVLVTRNEIRRGEIVSSDDCEIRTMDITSFAPQPYRTFSGAQNKKAARTINSGTILHDRLLLAIPVVEKDDAVSILYSSKRFSIAIPAIAREPGGIGDRIWVRNLNSNKLIRAQIREKGVVTVIQGELSI